MFYDFRSHSALHRFHVHRLGYDDAPSPEPGFKEPEIATKVETGKVLEPFEIGVDGGLFN